MMSEMLNEAAGYNMAGNKFMNDGLGLLNFDVLTQQLKSGATYGAHGRNAITLYKTPGLCWVLIALQPGSQIKCKGNSGSTGIQVMEGVLQLNTGLSETILHSGQMAVMDKNLAHQLLAKAACVLLLTLASPQEEVPLQASL